MEIKFNGYDFATYKFSLIKNGIDGLDEMEPIRPDIVWVPGRDQPYYFGAFLGEKHITVTGVVEGSDRSDLRDEIMTLKEIVHGSSAAAKTLIFGDKIDISYQAVWDGTFSVRPVGSAIVGNTALVTIGFTVTTNRWT